MALIKDLINFTKLFRKGNEDSNFQIYVQTGDRRNAGTDAFVYIRLFDDGGNESEKITLDNNFKDDFERGQTDLFTVEARYVEKLNREGKIVRVELWKDDSWLSNDWYVDKIVVENKATNSAFVFPMFRWVKSKYHYNIVNFDTSLPQDDQYKEQREMELKAKREEYVYDEKKPGGPVQCKDVPQDEKFSFDYRLDISATAIRLQAASKVVIVTQGEWKSIDDMKSIYTETIFTTPDGLKRWNDDFFFGFQRVASMNSSVIKLMTSIPEKFPVTDEILKDCLQGLTIKQAIVQKRLFICDLEVLEGNITQDNYVLCAPIAMLFLNNSQQVVPVAIQLNQKPAANNPIFTPNCAPYTWSLAKMWYNNADAALHQGITHLGATHLLMEGLAVATHRNISQSHPIHKLLAPHFLYLININSLAVSQLIADGGWVDKVMNYGSKGMVYLYSKVLNDWRMNVEGNPREDLKRRGLDNEDILPSYFFRNDTLLLYGAIEKYVKAYVDLYYANEEVLKADYEIQNFAADLVKPKNGASGGLGLVGVPGNGELTEIANLVEILTCIIYTCSVTHAAVNFPQYDEYGYPLNYPLMLRGTPPTDADKVMTEADVLAAAPDMPTTLDIMTITKILSDKGTNSLGDFEVQYAFEPKAKEVITEFRSDLEKVNEEIGKRNLTRRPIYEYLLPENIPNAISI